MQRIKLEVFKTFFEKNLTGNEIDFIIALSHLQNVAGTVCGLHYRKIMKETGMSAQAFYDCKRTLSEKGIIRVVKGHNDYDITLIGNDFSMYSDSDYKEGRVPVYISTNRKMFYDINWGKLKPAQKLLAIELMNINTAGGHTHRIKRKEFFKKYANSINKDGSNRKGLLNINARTLQKYLILLRLYFYIGLKDGMYYITLRKQFAQKAVMSEHDITLKYLYKTSCRRSKIENENQDKKEKEDIMQILYIYRNALSKCFEKIPGLFTKMLEILNAGIVNKQKWKKRLKASLFHKLLKEELGIQ